MKIVNNNLTSEEEWPRDFNLDFVDPIGDIDENSSIIDQTRTNERSSERETETRES